MVHGKVDLICPVCGRAFQKYPSQIKRYNFCSRDCLAAFSNKSKNPDGYADLRDFSASVENMRQLALKYNPMRMTDEVKDKLRQAHWNTGAGVSYAKYHGRHEHRVVAKQILGRKLKPGEVVHHIDRNKRNNAPENLMVFASQAEHAAWHKLHDGEVIQ